jgi:hypothetical protein
MTSAVKKSGRPWASGPAEILQHGINLLQDDTDANRRLALLSIDNAVEVMIVTYLGLPKRITKLQITRKEVEEMKGSFPRTLETLERHASDKLAGIELAEIEWYHGLQGCNGWDFSGATHRNIWVRSKNPFIILRHSSRSASPQ